MNLANKKCTPCEGGTPPLGEADAKKRLEEVSGWSREGKKIVKKYSFSNFKEAMAFVNRVADIAEEEGHHPDIFVSYNKVTLSLTTHAIAGLSENDFILAAKIDGIKQ